MDYEKKYKDALRWIKDVYPTFEGAVKEDAEHFFPELKKSEDEKIRKAILTGLIDCRDAPDLMWSDFGGIPIDDCIAWLEKQDPKKHEEELENAYKTADEVQYKRGYEDAVKEMEKQGEQNLVNETDEEIVEAVKDTSVLDMVEPNPAWSVYDEEYLRRAIKATNDVYPMTADWLKSLKDRVQPQWKPSEEQIKDFGGALLILKLQHYASSESLQSLYEQLKKL